MLVQTIGQRPDGRRLDHADEPHRRTLVSSGAQLVDEAGQTVGQEGGGAGAMDSAGVRSGIRLQSKAAPKMAQLRPVAVVQGRRRVMVATRSVLELSQQVGRQLLLDSGYDQRLHGFGSADSGRPSRPGRAWWPGCTFPTITFTSTRIEPAGWTPTTMVGDLTIKRTTKPLALKVVRYGEVNDPRMGHRVQGTAPRARSTAGNSF